MVVFFDSMEKKKKLASRQDQVMVKIFRNPQYKGKHVIVIADKIFTAPTGEAAILILKRVRRENPKAIPAITYIPDADSLILWL